MISFERRSDSEGGRKAARAFKEWVLSLTWRELTEMARIPLTADDETLLQEMVAAHVPPETPIHARACPSISYIFDGRSLAEQKKRRREHTPRLLQLQNKTDIATLSLPSNMPYRKRRNKTLPTPKAAGPADYTVKGRNFIQRDGDRLSIPPLRELLEAEQEFVKCLVLVPVKQLAATLGTEQQTSNNAPIQSILRWTIFRNSDFECKKSAVEDTYKLWYFVSRGELGTSDGKGTNLCTADWLDPTDPLCRPFSLGMYILSRFEYVLYKRFKAKDSQNLLEPMDSRFSATTWHGALSTALQTDVNQISPLQNPRHCLIWKLLDEQLAVRSNESLVILRNETLYPFSAGSLPLLLLDSSTGLIWKDLRRAHYEHQAHMAEMELLGDLEDEETVKASPNKQLTTKKSKPTKGKKKKGKAKNTSISRASSEEDISEMSKDSSGSDNPPENLTVLPVSVTLNNVPLTREQNKNLVMALSILDDVLENVFQKVGIGNEFGTHFVNGLVPVGAKPPQIRKQGIFTKGKAKNLVPQRNAVETNDTSSTLSTQVKQNVGSAIGTSRNIRPMPDKSPARSSLPVEYGPVSAPSRNVQEGSNWPFYADGFIPHPAAQLGGPPLNRSLDPGGAALGGMGEHSTYNAFVNPGWLRNGHAEAPIWQPHNLGASNNWRAIEGLGGRDRSIMEEFFITQQERELEADENQMASSTVASIASSTEDVKIRVEEVMDVLEEDPLDEGSYEDVEQSQTSVDLVENSECVIDPDRESSSHRASPFIQENVNGFMGASGSHDSGSNSKEGPPILLVSLEDIRGLSKDIIAGDKDRDSSSNILGTPSVRSFSSVPVRAAGTTSLPKSPPDTKPRLVSSLSRENLRMSLSEDKGTQSRTPSRAPGTASDTKRTPRTSLDKFVKMKSRDDTEIRPRGYLRKPVDALNSYRNAAARSLKSRDDAELRELFPTSYSRMPSSYKAAAVSQHERARVFGPLPFHARGSVESDRNAVSEIGDDDFPQLHESRPSVQPEEGDNITVTRDGSTTITSALSQRETEDTLREERDTYRDLCLTLGAEVASLKNLLASYRGSVSYAPIDVTGEFGSSNGAHQFFDPDSMANIVTRYSRPQTMAAMSDAGYRGEHESMASEDDIAKDKGSMTHRAQANATAAAAGSDVSVDHSIRPEIVPVTVPTLLNSHYQAPTGGFQSRLGRDILQFINNINSVLQKQDTRRAKAVERMTRLVSAVWPRAQVKVYGSHVTGLCLPKSDVDFVVCLPAVHKNAPAVAPGALEGRNAINETSQKLLARKLKSESWIDPRSMQLIDRTVVPVIKVSTKDAKARSVHLDITFDSPGHHGVEAVDMVLDIMRELPVIRPLVLVLKSFLDDRNLLSAYRGGLSSYCLFLMTARYLQEQSSSWGDCGSLLMGFLDFYGNHFNARTTGISVRNRIYFARPSYGPAFAAQPVWHPQVAQRHHVRTIRSPTDKSFYRRNSFNDKGGIDGLRGTTTGVDKIERHPAAGFQLEAVHFDPTQVNYAMPTFEFDPLFVEDPLSPGNNVGRNAFRFPQIQRSFSDAHRALLAALEWDLEAAEDLHDTAEYPLLKCLLRSEDIVCDL